MDNIAIEGLPIESDYTDAALAIINFLEDNLNPKIFNRLYDDLVEVLVDNQP